MVFIQYLSPQSRKRYTAAADDTITRSTDDIATDREDIYLEQSGLLTSFHQFHARNTENGRRGSGSESPEEGQCKVIPFERVG